MPLPTFFNLPAEKRQKILDCAMDEFSQNDYASASVSKIVSRAGIAKGSLYQYFVDKQDLYTYLLELTLRQKAEMLTAFAPPAEDHSFFGTLHYLFKVMITFETRYPKLAQIGNRAITGNAPLPDEIMQQARRSSDDYFFNLIEAGKQSGEIRADLDSALAAFVFSSSLAGMSEYLNAKKKKEPEGTSSLLADAEIEEAFNQVVSIFRQGIINPSETKEKTDGI
ncbi:MAG: TetR/AcrR family transcriptional regulator [Anaerolineaceae bacterium]|jgi:AcrR family transcriptional regulator|nr:TetR/AcrR family transcriptional regulator [Anaerolineaceae bacterium]